MILYQYCIDTVSILCRYSIDTVSILYRYTIDNASIGWQNPRIGWQNRMIGWQNRRTGGLRGRLGVVQADSGQVQGGQGRAPDKFRGRHFCSSFPRGKNHETLSVFFFGSSSDETGVKWLIRWSFFKKKKVFYFFPEMFVRQVRRKYYESGGVSWPAWSRIRHRAKRKLYCCKNTIATILLQQYC